MRIGGITCKKIAHDLGVSISAVSKVVLGQRRSAAIEDALCRALELPFSRLHVKKDEETIRDIYGRRLTKLNVENARSLTLAKLGPLYE